MCAASPARNSRPRRIGALTNERIGSTDFSVIGAGVELPALEGEARGEVVPDPVVGPVLDLLVGVDLQVQPRDLRRAHRVQREALGVPGVDQLVGRRRGVGQDAQPGVGVGALPHLPAGALLHDRPRDAVEAVGAGDDVALEHLRVAVGVGEPDPGAVGVDVLGRDVGDLEQQRRAAVQLRLDQVLGDLGLAVDPDGAPAQLREVQLVPGAGVLQVDAAVLEALALQPVADAGLGQRVDGVLLEDAGADARLDVVAGPVLEHDGVDALQGQQPREQQTGRAGADDAYLGAHGAECDRADAPLGTAILPVSGSRGSGPARGRCRGRPPRAPAPAGRGRGGAAGRRCRAPPPRPAPARPLDLHRHGQRGRARRHLLRRPGVPRRRTSASSRRSRPGSTTVCRVIRVSDAERLVDDLVRGGGEQHLAHAGRVQRQPAADLADHRHRLAAGDPLDVERAAARRGRRGARCRGWPCARRGGTVRPPGAARAAPARAGRGPRACGRSRSGRPGGGPARPTRSARPSSRCAVVSGVPERSAISDSDSRGCAARRRRARPARGRSPSVRGSRCHRPWPLLRSFHPVEVPLGQRNPRPYCPGMTGTTSASGLHLPRSPAN